MEPPTSTAARSPTATITWYPTNGVVSIDTAAWDLNGHSNGVSSLNLNGGSITSGSGQGTLRLEGDGIYSTGQSLIDYGVTVDLDGGNRTFNVPTFSDTLTINGTIIGSNGNGISKAGGGVLNLGSQNSYTGITDINGGTLQNGTNEAVPTGEVLIENGAFWDLSGLTNTVNTLELEPGNVENVGQLNLNGNITSTGPSLIDGTGQIFLGSNPEFDVEGTLSINPGLVGSGNVVTKTGGGVLALNGQGSGTNFDIQAGTLQSGNDNIVGNLGEVNIDGGTWDLLGHSDSIGALFVNNGALKDFNTLTSGGTTVIGDTGNATLTIPDGISTSTLFAFDLTLSDQGGVTANVTVAPGGTITLDNVLYIAGNTTTFNGGDATLSILGGYVSANSGVVVGAFGNGTLIVGNHGGARDDDDNRQRPGRPERQRGARRRRRRSLR